MEALCVSLDMAKRLKAAGFSQVSELYWVITMTTNYHLSWYPDGDLPDALNNRNDCFAAPTVQELADQLPPMRVDLEFGPSTRVWIATYDDLSTTTSVVGDTMAEAVAILWLKLHEAQS